MKQRKGFTLTELLAVIAILAIMAVILTPVIIDLIKDAEIKSAESSALGYITSFEEEIAVGRLEKTSYEDGEYAVEGEFFKNNPLSYKGIGPSKGKISVANQKIVSAELCVNGYPIKYADHVAKYNESANTCDSNVVFEDRISSISTGKMKAPTDDTSSFYGSTISRSNVERIITTNTNVVPGNAKESIDVSEAGDRSVMAWFLDADNNGKYELYIGQKGKVILSSGRDLFNGFSSVTSMDFSYLDTSGVTDMEFMFMDCSSLKNLDLSMFDTNNVTSMLYMFSDCTALETLNLNFNTSQLTNVSGMFYRCYELTTLILGKFDIGKVTAYNELFKYDTKLATIRTTNATTKTWLEARVKESSISANVVLDS